MKLDEAQEQSRLLHEMIMDLSFVAPEVIPVHLPRIAAQMNRLAKAIGLNGSAP